jgi:hypothetical protein
MSHAPILLKSGKRAGVSFLFRSSGPLKDQALEVTLTLGDENTRMTPSLRRSLWVWPALLLFSSACGKSTNTSPTEDATTPPTSTATVTLVANPNPAVAAPSANPAYAWSVGFVATLSNTNTSALTIKSITVDLQQASAGIVITPLPGTDEVVRFDVRAPGNRVETNGTMNIPFTFFYSLPNGGREALISLSIAVATDAGASGAVTTTVTVQ